MLKKLLKYELRATARVMLPVYLAMLVMTVIAKFFFWMVNYSTNTMQLNSWVTAGMGISMGLYVMVITAAVVMTFVVIVQRFYKNLFTDEGYLMNTLPVTNHQHILSKLLIASFWSIICGIVITLSIIILVTNDVNLFDFFGAIGDVFSQLSASETFHVWIIFIEIILSLLLSFVSSVLMIYVSIALGQLFNDHKILASFGIYIAITVGLQIIGVILMLIVTTIYTSSGFDLNAWMTASDINAMITIHGFMWLMIIANAVLGGVFYGVTAWIMKNKLNLE